LRAALALALAYFVAFGANVEVLAALVAKDAVVFNFGPALGAFYDLCHFFLLID